MAESKDRNPISKALKALSWLTEFPKEEVGVRELAAALRVSPSSAHRILHALSDAGYVHQNQGSQRYSLGIEFMRLAHLAIDKSPIRHIGIAAMRRLVDQCNETAVLGLYDSSRQEMIFAAAVDSNHALRYAIELNTWLPIYAGASGLAIMAFLEDDEIRSVIKRTRLAAVTENTITDPQKLESELARIRRNGFAISRGQRIPGAVGVAAPILNANGRVLGDICITVPGQRYSRNTEARLIETLLKTTKEISEKLKY